MLTLKHRLLSATIIASILVTGCAKKDISVTSEKPAAESVSTIKLPEEIESKPSETAPEPEPFSFNPHVYSCFLDACYGEEYKESFFNLVDALGEGKDSFKCSNRKVYEFCMDPVTLNQLYPVACMQINGKKDGKNWDYENGVGKINYEKPVEEYLERQKKFRQDVADIINKYIKADYSDFEKCLALCDYIATDYTYDHDGVVGKTPDGSSYLCFTMRKGICCDFGAWYAYLLMQCGVNAIEVQNLGEKTSAGYHAWTFVEINGKGYHIDPTWCLKSELYTEDMILDYFMMTDEDRAKSGYTPEELQVPLFPGFFAADCDKYKFTANDRTYRMPAENCYTGRYDTAKNVIYYYEGGDHENIKEFRYE